MITEETEKSAKIGEVVIANAALIRTLIVFLKSKKLVTDAELDLLFELAKQEMVRYDPRGITGAIAFLDHQRKGILIREDPEEPTPNIKN